MNVAGRKDGAVRFEGLTRHTPEIARVKLNRVLKDAGMADEIFIRRIVADLMDANVDKLLLKRIKTDASVSYEGMLSFGCFSLRVCSLVPSILVKAI